jgi:uncharacterized protein (TIGR03086 family)
MTMVVPSAPASECALNVDVDRQEAGMADLVELHGRCGQRFAALVAGIRSDRWHDSTPCTDWDVRTLVHHLLYEQRWVAPLLDGMTVEQVGDQFEGDLMGDEPATWPELLSSSIDEAHAVVARPGALERTVHLSYADVPGEEYVMQLTADLAIHAWDLARGTGQDDTLDPDAVALVLPWTEANADLLTGSGLFGTRIDVGPDAPDDVRLLGLMGRQA